MQIKCAVRLMPVQENSDAGNGDMCHRQRKQDDLPPGDIPQAMSQPIHGRIQHSPVR